MNVIITETIQRYLFFRRRKTPMKYRHSILTKKELHIMEIFWKEGRPLTSVDIHSIDSEYTSRYLHFILNSLQKKGFLEAGGKVRYEHRSAQSFRTVISRSEYLAQVSNQFMSDSDTVPNLLLALSEHLDESSEKEELLSQLKQVITEIKPK